MFRMLSATAIVAGLVIASATPALAATPNTRCDQARAAVMKLHTLSDNATNPALKKVYLNMAKSEEAALSYYC